MARQRNAAVLARGPARLDAAVRDVNQDADRGAHSPFVSKAHGHDPLLWASMHRRSLISATGAAAVAGIGLLAARSR